MRKVELTMTEQVIYEIVKDFVDHREERNFKRLCLKLQCSKRTAQRKIAGYNLYGKAYFRHKNHDRKPARTIPDEIRAAIISLYNTYYPTANFIHFSELLPRNHPDIPAVSLSSLRNIFKEADILSPKSHKKTIRALRKKTTARTTDTPPVPTAATPPAECEHPHARREKSRYAGEIIYVDASMHRWFGNTVTALHAAIDDATGTVVGAYFCQQETLVGYYQLLAQLLRNYGIPAAFHTDGRTVFQYKKAGVRSTPNDTPTQFTYACQTLGIAVCPSYSAQAQGKVERLFQTWQSRLPIELAMAGVSTIEEANRFMSTQFLPSFNEQFASPVHPTMSVFEEQPSEERINLTLAVLTPRTVDAGHAIAYKNRYYRFIKKDGTQAFLRNHQKVLVICALDGTLFASCREEIYALEQIADHKAFSSEFDSATKPPKVPKAPYVPPMWHPWKMDKFRQFEEHRLQYVYSFPEACCTTDPFANSLE